MKTVSLAIFRWRKPRFWLCVGLFAAVVALLMDVWWPDGFGGGPIYQDRTASEWLAQAEPAVEEGSSNAVEAFKAMGRDGVLFLARTLKMPGRERIAMVVWEKHRPRSGWVRFWLRF